MRFVLVCVAVFTCAVIGGAQVPQSPAAQAPAPPTPLTKVAFFDHDATAAALAKGGVLVNAPDMIVQGSHREAPGQVEVHEKETDVIFIADGAATFVTGGTMTGGRVTRPGQWLGADITGGETRRLTKGDWIVVPAGIPHWFKEVSPQVSYSVVKVVKP